MKRILAMWATLVTVAGIAGLIGVIGMMISPPPLPQKEIATRQAEEKEKGWQELLAKIEKKIALAKSSGEQEEVDRLRELADRAKNCSDVRRLFEIRACQLPMNYDGYSFFELQIIEKKIALAKSSGEQEEVDRLRELADTLKIWEDVRRLFEIRACQLPMSGENYGGSP